MYASAARPHHLKSARIVRDTIPPHFSGRSRQRFHFEKKLPRPNLPWNPPTEPPLPEQISNGRRGLQRSMARSTGPLIRLVETVRRRDRLRRVVTTTASCLEAMRAEGRVEGLLAAGRFVQAVATAGKILEDNSRR